MSLCDILSDTARSRFQSRGGPGLFLATTDAGDENTFSLERRAQRLLAVGIANTRDFLTCAV